MISNHLLPLGSYMAGFIYVESVKPDFVYLMRGCGIPCSNKRCDAPHFIQTWGNNICTHPYKMKSAVRRPATLKLPHFSLRTVRKHFLYVCCRPQSASNHKDKNIFTNEQHPAGHRWVLNILFLYFVRIFRNGFLYATFPVASSVFRNE